MNLFDVIKNIITFVGHKGYILFYSWILIKIT